MVAVGEYKIYTLEFKVRYFTHNGLCSSYAIDNCAVLIALLQATYYRFITLLRKLLVAYKHVLFIIKRY